jgi:predicted nucleic acid-binding protein
MTIANTSPTIAFIDTNVWLYAFSKTQDPTKTQHAKALIRRERQIAISTQVINEVSYNLLKKFQADERDIRRLTNSFYRKYLVIEFQKDVYHQASNLRLTYHFSFWDSLIVASALASDARKLFSEDMHDGLKVNDQLIIVNPFKASTSPE